MKIYRITKSYSYENGEYGGPVVWFHLFKRAAIRLAARLAEDFGGTNTSVLTGREREILNQRRDPSERNAVYVAEFRNPKNEHWIAIDRVHLAIFQPFSAIRRRLRQRLSWQNLNEKGEVRGKTIKGSILRHGRAWLRPKDRGDDALALHWSWTLWTHFFGADIRIGTGDCEMDVTLFVGCGLFAFWFTIENVMPKRLREWGERRALATPWMRFAYMAWPRQTGIAIHNGNIWVEIWNWDSGWDSKQPKWMAFNFSPIDFLLGDRKYSHKTLASETRTLTMPEAIYSVDVELAEDSWKRPRWPWPTKIMRAHIECPSGIPVPGKGENSWDCGEDATFGLTCGASSFQDAMSKLYETVMSSRERHGGRNWMPEQKVKIA